jgi:hypothetical protein
MESAVPHIGERGESLLLQHCRALDEPRTPAYDRLEETLGRNLTRLLVAALAARLLHRRDAA